jgi:hypothetical protein
MRGYNQFIIENKFYVMRVFHHYLKNMVSTITLVAVLASPQEARAGEGVYSPSTRDLQPTRLLFLSGECLQNVSAIQDTAGQADTKTLDSLESRNQPTLWAPKERSGMTLV